MYICVIFVFYEIPTDTNTPYSFTYYTENQRTTVQGRCVFGPAITEVAGFSAASGNAGEFHKFGLDAGILVNSKLGKKSELQMEFAFIQEGSQIKPDTTNNNNYYTFNLNYISLALLYRKHIHISVSKKPTDQMGFEAGLSYNVLAGYKYEL